MSSGLLNLADRSLLSLVEWKQARNGWVTTAFGDARRADGTTPVSDWRVWEPSRRAGLAGRRTETVEPLPKSLPGIVCRQWVRCGKPSCRCAQGRGHGPYFYRFWREEGRLRKAYVPRKDVAEVSARCRARREEQRLLRTSFRSWREIARRLQELEDWR
jgi:hypothetical protein